MSIRFRFDRDKAVEALVYIAHRTPEMYKVLKILYFADKQHLAKYGRLICGDSYVAMRHGPVPSGAYDLIKYARGDGVCWKPFDIAQAFVVQNERVIVPQREARLDLLSESDIECLDAAITEYGALSFGHLKALSHDHAYNSTDENDFIAIESIIETLPDSAALLDYIRGN